MSEVKTSSAGHGLFEHDSHAAGAVKRARRLRRETTGGEAKVWAELRKLKMNFRRQTPIGKYVVDFVHHGGRLIIEIDGGIHDLPEVQLRDEIRDAWLQSQGYTVLRISNDLAHADAGYVANMILDALPSKALPLNGGGLGGGGVLVSEIQPRSAPNEPGLSTSVA
ncbi:MAG: endonuclease domain-containing protein, partial [Caulobacteraceae bacterium]